MGQDAISSSLMQRVTLTQILQIVCGIMIPLGKWTTTLSTFTMTIYIYIYTYIYSTYTVTVLWLHFLLVLIMYMYFYPETLTMNSKQWHIRYTATAVFIHFHSLGFLAPFLFEQYWFKLTDKSNWRYSIDQNWSMAVSTCGITVKGYPLPTPQTPVFEPVAGLGY